MLGKKIELQAADGHTLSAYRAEPAGKAKGAVIVVMEIFGVNSYVRSVADEFAADGYLAIAPAMFDRVQRDFESGYSPPEIEVGRGIMQKASPDDAVKDVAAALENAQSAGKVAVVGYCWGGTVAFKAACDLSGLACAIAYYGGGLPGLIGLKPKCPVLFQWGETDASIPLDKAKEFAAAHKDQSHYFYAGAGHGFSCDQRPSFNAEAAKLAKARTLEFLQRHVG